MNSKIEFVLEFEFRCSHPLRACVFLQDTTQDTTLIIESVLLQHT